MRLMLDERGALEHTVLALGMFDGVHIGHRALLLRARALARRRGAQLVAVTFAQHPLALVAPDKCPPMLSTFDERARLLENLGVDVLYAMPFDAKLMATPPECYVGELVRRFRPTDVVCGYNHTFGKGGKGNPAFLAALGDALDFCTSVVPKIMLDGREVSSSAIRALLAAGDVRAARQLLGRPYGRHVKITWRKGEVVARFAEDGKQPIGAGRYRAQWERQGLHLPVTVTVAESGGATCSSEYPLPIKEGALLFVSQRP